MLVLSYWFCRENNVLNYRVKNLKERFLALFLCKKVLNKATKKLKKPGMAERRKGMVRLFLSLTHYQMRELKEHFFYNGYHVDWETDDVITVDEDEVEEVKTILRDEGIGFAEGKRY